MIGETARDLAALPPEIAFLARHGVPDHALQAMAALAADQGTSADRAAIAAGLISEAAYIAALAAEIGAPFITTLPPLAAGADAHLALRTRIVPLADPTRRFVIAPEAGMVAPLLNAGPQLRASVALMAPSRFRQEMRARIGPAIAAEAALGLWRASPELSARDGPSRRQIAALAALVFLLGFFGTLEPALTLVVGGLLLGPLFLLVATFRIAATFETAPQSAVRRTPPRDADLPAFTVLVPLFREERVLDQLIGALAALDYPRAKLDVKLLVEADDTGLIVALAERTLPPFIETVIVPAGEPRTKPRALNAGLLEARGTFLTIFDAEDIPEPDQLRRAATMLMASPRKVACLQARLAIDNAADSLLARLFALEYAGLFDVINPGLTRSRLPFLLGGTSNHFRTQALRDVGGWDAWNVTEDADLAIRLVRAGLRLGDCPATTWEEAPISLGPWMRQRRRWMKGFLQCAITHGRQPLRTLGETGAANGLALIAMSLGTVASALFYPPFLIAALWMLATTGLPSANTGLEAAALSLSLTLFVAGHIAIFVPPLIGGLRRGNRKALVSLPLIPAYLVLVSIAAWWALIDLTLTPFHWHKTEHGQGRRAPPKPEPLTAGAANPPLFSPAADRR